MDETKKSADMIKQEEAKAEVEIWNYVFSFVPMAVAKCAIELKIADILETQNAPMALSDLSSAIGNGCMPSSLQRIMRFLVHHGIFKVETSAEGTKGYAQTPLSRMLLSKGDKSMAAFILLMSSPAMMAPCFNMSNYVTQNNDQPPFTAANGEDIWSYATANPGFRKTFNDSMACESRLSIQAIINGCRDDVLDGVGTLVDVGGGDGTLLRRFVKEFPWIHGINFDLPSAVSEVPESKGIENIGGDMFESVPKADAIMLKWILHDWGDKEAIHILKNCKAAIPENGGKVVIVDIVIEEDDMEDERSGVRMILDMGMMAFTNTGKERTLAEWKYVLGEAGFSHHTVKKIQALQSIIVAFP